VKTSISAPGCSPNSGRAAAAARRLLQHTLSRALVMPGLAHCSSHPRAPGDGHLGLRYRSALDAQRLALSAERRPRQHVTSAEIRSQRRGRLSVPRALRLSVPSMSVEADLLMFCLGRVSRRYVPACSESGRREDPGLRIRSPAPVRARHARQSEAAPCAVRLGPGPASESRRMIGRAASTSAAPITTGHRATSMVRHLRMVRNARLSRTRDARCWAPSGN
jgi:hypothetical protein